MGLWDTDAASLLRYRRQIGARHVKLFFNVTPEFAAPIGARPIGLVAESAVVSSLADVIPVSEPRAGTPPDLEVFREVKERLNGRVPVLVNTGATVENVAQFLSVADGVIVGSGLKRDGYTWNPVDERRVQEFVAAVREIRAHRP